MELILILIKIYEYFLLMIKKLTKKNKKENIIKLYDKYIFINYYYNFNHIYNSFNIYIYGK